MKQLARESAKQPFVCKKFGDLNKIKENKNTIGYLNDFIAKIRFKYRKTSNFSAWS